VENHERVAKISSQDSLILFAMEQNSAADFVTITREESYEKKRKRLLSN